MSIGRRVTVRPHVRGPWEDREAIVVSILDNEYGLVFDDVGDEEPLYFRDDELFFINDVIEEVPI